MLDNGHGDSSPMLNSREVGLMDLALADEILEGGVVVDNSLSPDDAFGASVSRDKSNTNIN